MNEVRRYKNTIRHGFFVLEFLLLEVVVVVVVDTSCGTTCSFNNMKQSLAVSGRVQTVYCLWGIG